MNAPRPADDFLIAALGASAGGLEPLEQFFAHMPDDAGIACLVVQHLAPDHPTALPEILARFTRMPVEEANDNTVAHPNRVYIIPPNATLTIKDGSLRVQPPTQPRGFRAPIDSLFRSLAEDRGEKAVCIILSGTGSDGTIGLRSIKEHGGMAMAQALETAKYDTILRSAIATGLVDHVLPVEEMPAKLLDYDAYLRSLREKPNSFSEQISTELSRIFELILGAAGHDFSQYKQSTIIRRLQRRMNASQIDGVEGYVELLERHPEEIDLLVKDLLIGVTEFFRDPDAFDALRRVAIPKLFEGKGPDDSVRACVVGCSSGEEAYSMAILLAEYAATLTDVPKIQVFATDIDERGLELARKGRYPVSIADEVSPDRLERFFNREDGTYQIKRELRDRIIFSAHSFIKDPPFSRLDLISCRNVMIYLGVELQRKILPLFHYALRPGGYLFLGPSESVGPTRELFEAADKKQQIYRRNDLVPKPHITFPTGDIGRAPGAKDRRELGAFTQEGSVLTQLQKFILQRYRPACVAVRENGEAVFFSGSTGRYLEQPTCSPETNVLGLAREGLSIPLRTALHNAVSSQTRAVQTHIPVGMNGGVVHVDIAVEPIVEVQNAKLYMITFEDSPVARAVNGETSTSGGGSEEIIRHLESELRAARERAQAMYEELESSNEELRSTNEEYQSTNEELETSKEELQSFNEELETVNAELRRKVAELDHANSDLQNLLDSTQIATIFLDAEFRIKSFTPAAGTVFSLLSSDAGRPITDLAARFSDGDFLGAC